MPIGTTEAASLLSICVQRVRQLLKEGRIIGAKKVRGFWQIPLKNGMPQITDATKGPKGTWRKRVRKALTIIHIDSKKFRKNREKNETEPVILVRQGSHCPTACHEVVIEGFSRLVYRPNQPLSSNGEVLRIEVEPDVNVITRVFPKAVPVA